MKILSKVSATGTLGLMLTFSILPMNSLAISSQPTTAVQHGFCVNLASDESTISSGINSRMASLAQNRANSAAKLLTDRSNVDTEVAADRTKWDATRQQDFTAIQSKATTDAQKLAVTTFEQATIGYVNTRRSTVDEARSSFRAGEDAAIASRQSEVNADVATFKAAVASTESTAQSSCDAGATPSTVRTTFVASLKLARTSYTTAIRSVPSINTSVKTLVSTRNATITTTDASFKADVQHAAATLKAVLHN